ncbi:hypothetical protein D3C85_861510 [compost metagenome]
MVNTPLASVDAAFVVPSNLTVAPGKGEPFCSVTFPVTGMSCANKASGKARRQ